MPTDEGKEDYIKQLESDTNSTYFANLVKDEEYAKQQEDEIAKKMIQYANLYDDFKDAYNNIKRSNLGIQETYKKMLEYWNLHHQDKTKGKRLTIKEV